MATSIGKIEVLRCDVWRPEARRRSRLARRSSSAVGSLGHPDLVGSLLPAALSRASCRLAKAVFPGRAVLQRTPAGFRVHVDRARLQYSALQSASPRPERTSRSNCEGFHGATVRKSSATGRAQSVEGIGASVGVRVRAGCVLPHNTRNFQPPDLRRSVVIRESHQTIDNEHLTPCWRALAPHEAHVRRTIRRCWSPGPWRLRQSRSSPQGRRPQDSAADASASPQPPKAQHGISKPAGALPLPTTAAGASSSAQRPVAQCG